jgi:ribosomal protein S18 acetylase RimI-like enzyme
MRICSDADDGREDGDGDVREQEAPQLPPYEVRRLTDADAGAIQDLYVRCTAFVELVEGRPPTSREGQDLLHAKPPGVKDEDKLVFGIFDDGRMVGALDILRGYPDPETWYLGLLMLSPDTRNHGLGGQAYEAVRRWVGANGGKAVRLVVQAQNNAALRFWERQGFVVIGTATSGEGGAASQVFRLEHRLTTLDVAPITEADIEDVVALWDVCGLIRPWNDPRADIALALRTPTATVLVGRESGRVVAAAMAGSDGHRGWVYYVAAEPGLQRQGHGRAIMVAAEDFLRRQGVPKIELMVRTDNLAARGFYDRLGYSTEDVVVMSRRFPAD